MWKKVKRILSCMLALILLLSLIDGQQFFVRAESEVKATQTEQASNKMEETETSSRKEEGSEANNKENGKQEEGTQKEELSTKATEKTTETKNEDGKVDKPDNLNKENENNGQENGGKNEEKETGDKGEETIKEKAEEASAEEDTAQETEAKEQIDATDDTQERFGEKVYKVTLNGGMSCPNRDGKIGTRGCIFCSAGGSGDFAADAALSITDQIESQISILSQKRPIHKYIAYFQAYTNTYAPVEYLEKIFTEAISHPKIVALSIGTRPDCLSPEIVTLLSRLNKQKPVWIELGLQTIHESTAKYIRRGYPLCVFDDAVKRLRKENIEVIVHTILGLPGENTADILETMEYLNHMDIQGIKLQLLHVLRGTDLAADYEKGLFQTYERDEYISLLINCLEHLRPDMVIHRITGDGPKDLLIAPLWASRKREVLNMLHHRMKEEQSYQGRLFSH